MTFNEQYEYHVVCEGKISDFLKKNADKLMKKFNISKQYMSILTAVLTTSSALTYTAIDAVAAKMGYEMDPQEIDHLIHIGEHLTHYIH